MARHVDPNIHNEARTLSTPSTTTTFLNGSASEPTLTFQTTTVGEPRKTLLQNLSTGSEQFTIDTKVTNACSDEIVAETIETVEGQKETLERKEKVEAHDALTPAALTFTPIPTPTTTHLHLRPDTLKPSHSPPITKATQHNRRLADWRRSLLTEAGDVELNPGPNEGEDHKRCGECQKAIKTGPGFLTCSTCGNFSHKQKKCSMTTKHEIGKMTNDTNTWKCIHCRPRAQDETEAGKENEEGNDVEDTRGVGRKYCKECKGYIKAGDRHLECNKCEKPCHKKSDCSGVSRDRVRMMKEGSWRCKECKDPEAYARVEERKREGAGQKSNCFICKKMIKATDRRMECSRCKKETHLKEGCSGETRKAIAGIEMENWVCPRCTDVEAEREARKNREDNPEQEIEFVVGGKLDMEQVRVLQWNADSFAAKKDEFKQVIQKNKIDIFLVQETKMTAQDKVPVLPGYTILSKPRSQPRGKENVRGGGVMMGIRNTIPYREIKDYNIRDTNDGITEWQMIEIPLSNKEKWRLTNLYIPSERAGDCRDSSLDSVVTTKFWPKGKDDLLAGDVNAHSSTWDEAMEKDEGSDQADKRGKMIDEWMEENDMVTLNSGERTHANRKTGREMTPDVSIVHGENMDRYQWKVLKQLGGSDHYPVMITREIEGLNRVNEWINAKWDLKNAQWDDYRQQVEEKVPTNYEKKKIHKLEKVVRKILIEAGNHHIGNKNRRKDTKPGYSKKVKEEIDERNKLKTKVQEPGGRERWVKKCREVNELIRKEKEENWREYVDELDTKTNCKQVWNTIRNLDGRISPRKENEVLVVEGKGYTRDKDKAKQFAKAYKRVSRIPRGPKDKIMKHQNRKFLNNIPKQRRKYEEDITWEELERAIDSAKNSKAPGEDKIPYEMIKQLGPKAKKLILHMYNAIWRGEPIPQAWRTAVILPMLKEGKDPELPSSYRPISLTDCLGKILEKIVAERMSAYMEENNLFNECQAGFRQERCTADQVWKLVQTAADKFQSQRDGGVATIVTFFDFEKAYDKVWREGLIAKMIKLDLPYSFIKYTRLFLSARRTTVEINGTRSEKFYLNEGLPQGSAISPLLFLIFINDITDYMTPGATPSLFADDTAASVECGKDKKEAEKRMQDNINGLEKWAEEWKMKLNGGKTQVMIISTSNNDLKWKPKLHLGERELEVVNEYKFLGVTIDSGLRFNAHVNKVAAKARRRSKILRCLAGKEWGQSLETQRALYTTYIRSSLEYAAPSWYPWISKSAKLILERVQNQCLKTMTRMASTTPVDFLRLQAGVEPLETRIEKNSMIQWEKYIRLEETDARRRLMEMEVKQRLKGRIGWRAETKPLMNHNLNRSTPKIRTNPMMKIGATITKVTLDKNKEAYTLEDLARLTEVKIAEIDADVEIFTDGSTSGTQQRGGAGVFAQDKNGVTLLEDKRAAGTLCSSYDGECVAMMMALEWITKEERGDVKYAIYTDSLSLINALEADNWKDQHEWLRVTKTLLAGTTNNITICWVPSHCNTYGNEKADRLADEGSKMDQSQAPVTFRIVRAKIRNRRWEIQHERAKNIYQERRKPKEAERAWPASIRRLYARLRSGHAKELKDYQKRFLKTVSSDICIYCEADAAETIKHILCDCSQLEERRARTFDGDVSIDMLTTHPDICRKILAARFKQLNNERKLVEDEGGGSPQDCTGLQA